ncbi:hypothetical protein ACFQFR_18730 [Streptomyces goshikiensis]
MTKQYGSASNGLSVALYSPYRALVDSKETSYDGKQAGVTLPKTAPVAYENRFSSDAEVRGTRLAGWYYLAVTLGGKVAEFTEDATPVPLTLRVQVSGDAAKAPAYGESLSAAGFGVGADERNAARDGLTAPEAADAAENRSAMGRRRGRVRRRGAAAARAGRVDPARAAGARDPVAPRP